MNIDINELIFFTKMNEFNFTQHQLNYLKGGCTDKTLICKYNNKLYDPITNPILTLDVLDVLAYFTVYLIIFSKFDTFFYATHHMGERVVFIGRLYKWINYFQLSHKNIGGYYYIVNSKTIHIFENIEEVNNIRLFTNNEFVIDG